MKQFETHAQIALSGRYLNVRPWYYALHRVRLTTTDTPGPSQ